MVFYIYSLIMTGHGHLFITFFPTVILIINYCLRYDVDRVGPLSIKTDPRHCFIVVAAVVNVSFARNERGLIMKLITRAQGLAMMFPNSQTTSHCVTCVQTEMKSFVNDW